MFRGQRAPRWFIQRDIQILIRSFPSERMTFTRPASSATDTNGFGEPDFESTPVYTGEVLFIPASGDVQRFGLGQVEEDRPQILVAGHPDIRQGDFVTHHQLLPNGNEVAPARRYQVMYPPNAWQAFVVVTLRNYEQGT